MAVCIVYIVTISGWKPTCDWFRVV